MTKKIAFLFLTLDNPNFPKIWDNYFKNNDNRINIYIHPKYPEKVTWHTECIIKDLKPTAWGFIVDAYKSLFKEALKNKDNIKFITISESCVPIKPFDTLYNDLIQNENESFIKLSEISKYDLEARINDEIKKKIRTKNLIKHYARMCLSRHHIKKILINKDKLNLFIKMHVGDEFFLSSIMPIHNFKDKAITFDDWDYVKKQYTNIKNEIRKLYIEQEEKKIDNTEKISKLKEQFNDIAKNPKKIFTVSKEDLDNMKKTDSYFYRKFDKESDIEKYIYKFI